MLLAMATPYSLPTIQGADYSIQRRTCKKGEVTIALG
jgi:hypothetical protein